MVIVDTCSLVYLSRFYLPFDKDGKLIRFLENQFRQGNLVMLDAIFDECKYQSQGFVVKSLPFLQTDKSLIVKTIDLTAPAPQKFSNQLDNNFCVAIAKRNMSPESYALQKQMFLESGDGKIIVFALNKIHEAGFLNNDIFVLTDESKMSNDGKLFKKLPVICKDLDIKTITLVDYLKENNISIDWSVPEKLL